VDRRRIALAGLLWSTVYGLWSAVGACTTVGTDPTQVVAIAFDSLPFPSIVAGDTLRDEAGVAQRLIATAFNSNGDVIDGAPFTFSVLDPGGTISAEGFLVSTDPGATSLRAVAQAGSLQSRPLSIVVTPRPDSMDANGTVPLVTFDLENAATQISGPVGVKVLSNTATPPAPVRSWLVHFSLEYRGNPVAENSTGMWLVDESDRRSVVDTTDAGGVAARRVRFTPASLLDSSVPDSITVVATSSFRGVPLAGAPVRIVVHVTR
jgi:hypothetical protein